MSSMSTSLAHLPEALDVAKPFIAYVLALRGGAVMWLLRRFLELRSVCLPENQWFEPTLCRWARCLPAR
jgi:hypothetical protein